MKNDGCTISKEEFLADVKDLMEKQAFLATGFINREKEKANQLIARIEKEIEAEYIAMNHQENTEFEKGKINGLIEAKNIVRKAAAGFGGDNDE